MLSKWTRLPGAVLCLLVVCPLCLTAAEPKKETFAKVAVTHTQTVLTNQNNGVTNRPSGESHVPISFDLNGGVFVPLPDLSAGMAVAPDVSLSGFVPADRIVPVDFLKWFDFGVTFYMVPGSAVSGRNAGIILLGGLLDVYYRLPLGMESFSVYAQLGMGISASSAWVANGTFTGTMSSADFTVRTGIGCRWMFLPHWYARFDVRYFMAFEKVSAAGLPVTLGVGYAF